MRYILYQLNRGELTTPDLCKNLEYVALALESSYAEGCKLIQNEEEVAQFENTDVPEEVREWLALTFTQQASQQPQKHSFKSVVNAIRTGIRLDRIKKRMSSYTADLVPPEVAELLKDLDSWEFDVFRLNDVSNNNALRFIGLELFFRYNFFGKFKIPMCKMEAFLNALQVGYSKHDNPYHNLVHGADVTQTANWMLCKTGTMECLSDLELFAYLFSAMIHDYEHTGHTNNFHVQSNSDYAMLYNDRSVLENHHISSIFRMMRADKQLNILSNLTNEEYREFRNLVIEIVLSTDMSTHFTQVKNLKTMLESAEGVDKVKALCFIIHCCDISHPSKPWYIHLRWTKQLLEEFFRQGDQEAALGLPCSPLCDRHTVQMAKSQIGFIDFIVEPTMIICGEMLNKLLEPLLSVLREKSTPHFNHDVVSDNR
ncbi:unnamed protein product [Soboliphyme baturini]|uniref:Phosphodiesterase n=1 Tax=Soboliphyme baturini TaxID=241478 RepID=A0A3P8E2A8_9BILA|nr:unnamed protein product [Soboliphyme baturini]